MIYAGIDIAKSDHVVGAVDDGGRQVAKPMPFKNSKDGFEKCVAWLEGVAESPSDAAVAMEATGRYWMACFAYLTARGYSVSVVNPVHVKAVRKLKDMIGVKNDRVDSWLIAETLRLGEYGQTRLATDEVQSLRTLTRYRQALAQEIGTVKTRAVCLMDAYFPEYAGLFSDMFGAASRASVGMRLGEAAAAFQVRELMSQLDYLDGKARKAEREIKAILMRAEPLIVTIPGVSVMGS